MRAAAAWQKARASVRGFCRPARGPGEAVMRAATPRRSSDAAGSYFAGSSGQATRPTDSRGRPVWAFARDCSSPERRIRNVSGRGPETRLSSGRAPSSHAYIVEESPFAKTPASRRAAVLFLGKKI
jgi:hypothetical protein